MTKIIEASAYLVDVEVETERTDAVQAFLKQETIFVELRTDDGATGTGYSYTIGTGGMSVLAMLREHLLPRLYGQDARMVEHLWYDLFAATRATTVGAITSLALAAVDTALWDLRCGRAGEPLWRPRGGVGAGGPELVRGAPASRRRRRPYGIGPLNVDPHRGRRIALLARAVPRVPYPRSGLDHPGRCRPGRRDHPLAEGRASGRDLQRPRLPALPDGAARLAGGRNTQRPLRRAHPAAACHHPQ